LLESKLATINYTGANKIDHYRVYYQISTKDIHQLAWNSSGRTWAALPVTTDLDVKEQTPISANIYWHSAAVRNPERGRKEIWKNYKHPSYIQY
jgi:hypothetical protein